MRVESWYRSDGTTPPAVRPSISRRLRHWLRGWLHEPDVRDKTMVLYAREGFKKSSRWAGMFSEFHSVLGALKYGEMHGAAGLRIDYRSPLYLDPLRGPNWWTYFFETALMPIRGVEREGFPVPPKPRGGEGGSRAAAADGTPSSEVHLNRVLSRHGKHGGFCDLVNGDTPYLYPMTYGVDREELGRLLAQYIHVKPEIRAEVDRFVAAFFEPGSFVVGVHYRGTDTTRHFAAAWRDYPTARTSYASYASEVRRAIDQAAPRSFQILVATDEITFLEFMRHAFGDRVLYSEDAPRVHPDALPIHFNPDLGVSNYQKGKSGLVDCLLLAATSYLVKGRSNLSDASLAFNPRLPYSFCLR